MCAPPLKQVVHKKTSLLRMVKFQGHKFRLLLYFHASCTKPLLPRKTASPGTDVKHRCFVPPTLQAFHAFSS